MATKGRTLAEATPERRQGGARPQKPGLAAGSKIRNPAFYISPNLHNAWKPKGDLGAGYDLVTWHPPVSVFTEALHGMPGRDRAIGPTQACDLHILVSDRNHYRQDNRKKKKKPLKNK